jgi:hypothetical protein
LANKKLIWFNRIVNTTKEISGKKILLQHCNLLAEI